MVKYRSKNIDVIVDSIINYENEKKLSWTDAYRDILKKLNMQNQDDDTLHEVVHEITKRGYDIIDKPFRLERYK